jgi:hypothetical protein
MTFNINALENATLSRGGKILALAALGVLLAMGPVDPAFAQAVPSDRCPFLKNRVLPKDPTYSAIKHLYDKTYLVAFDAKNFEGNDCKFSHPNNGAQREEYFASIQFDPKLEKISTGKTISSPAGGIMPVRLALGASVGLQNEPLPSDIEALCILDAGEKSGTTRFLAIESMGYKGGIGTFDRLFSIDAEISKGTAKITSVAKLSGRITAFTQKRDNIHRRFDDHFLAAFEFEAMLCEESKNRLHVKFADRGEANTHTEGGKARPAAILELSFKYKKGKFCKKDIAKNCGKIEWARKIIGPVPESWNLASLGPKDSVRYISDLVEMNGDIFASVALERDNKIVASAVWRVCASADCTAYLKYGPPLDLSDRPKITAPFGEKTEGLSIWQDSAADSTLVGASDNEINGHIFKVKLP